MEIEIFTACDNVQAYGDKLIVVGNFHQIQGSKLPITIDNLGVACCINMNADEAAQNNEIEFQFTSESDKVYRLPFQLKVEPLQNRATRIINIALNLGQIAFSTTGIHYIDLYINKQINRKFPINVVKK